MQAVIIDFETCSSVDLKKAGVWRYAQDFSTSILCLAYKKVIDFKADLTKSISDIYAFSEELNSLAKDPGTVFIAHNAAFEQAIWHFLMEPLGYPPLPPERWFDTMSVCAMKSLPLSLDKVSQFLNLASVKDMDGHKLMTRMSSSANSHLHTPANLQRLAEYCEADVNTQYDLWYAIRGLGPEERATWIADQRINQKGLLIDGDLVLSCIDLLEQIKPPLEARFVELTGVRPTQTAKVLEWINAQGVPILDLKKGTLDDILGEEESPDISSDLLDSKAFDSVKLAFDIPKHVLEALSIRRKLASSSVAKLQRMLDCMSFDGRVRYTTQYHGARTGRDAGRLIQIQNFPRGEISKHPEVNEDNLAIALKSRDLNVLASLWPSEPYTAIISSLRSCIIPAKGKKLYAADYAGVEARNLLSMAEQHDRAEQMYTGVDVYIKAAEAIFERPITKQNVYERTIGKSSVLSNGYGIGPLGFRNRCAPTQSIEFAKKVVDSYRKDFAPKVPILWYNLFEASMNAVWCQMKKAYSYKGIEFQVEDGFLTMRLPSQRKIYYPYPKPETNVAPNGEMRPTWSFLNCTTKTRKLAWHGMVTADCIQGASRDLLMSAMKKAEKEGLNVIFKVHDELVFEEEPSESIKRVIKDIMEDIDSWAVERQFKVTAVVEEMNRYRK